MRLLSALLVGVCSGFLIYIGSGLIIGPKEVSPLFVMTTFLVGWALTTYVVLKGAPTAAKVWSRGGLLGAVEWVIVGFAISIYSGKTLPESGALHGGNPDTLAGATLGLSLPSMMGLVLAVCMAIPCLIIYFVASRIHQHGRSNTQSEIR